MKAYGGSGCIDPHFLDLGTSWRWVVSFKPLPLYTRGNSPSVPIGQEAGWAPEPVWTMWRRENFCPHRDSNFHPSVVQPVASLYTDWATEDYEHFFYYLSRISLLQNSLTWWSRILFGVSLPQTGGLPWLSPVYPPRNHRNVPLPCATHGARKQGPYSLR
jgi:hypothetical protein